MTGFALQGFKTSLQQGRPSPAVDGTVLSPVREAASARRLMPPAPPGGYLQAHKARPASPIGTCAVIAADASSSMSHGTRQSVAGQPWPIMETCRGAAPHHRVGLDCAKLDARFEDLSRATSSRSAWAMSGACAAIRLVTIDTWKGTSRIVS